MPRDIAERNRRIKNVLTRAFGAGKVRVRGSRGTGYGWVTVTVDWTPVDVDQAAEMRLLCKQLLRKAEIDLGFTYTDDDCTSTSDQCHIDFNPARYFQTMRHSDGTMSAQREYMGEWENV